MADIDAFTNYRGNWDYEFAAIHEGMSMHVATDVHTTIGVGLPNEKLWAKE